MIGRTPITLFEPGDAEQDRFGDVSSRPAEHQRTASRRDRGGRAAEVALTDTGEWQREYSFVRGGLDIDHRWSLRDEIDNRIFTVESVIEVYHGRTVTLRVKRQA